MSYCELKDALSEVLGISVKEKPLKASDGRISGYNIAIREDIESDIDKKCVLYEELGHLFTTVGDITRCSSVDAMKQEHRARRFAYNAWLPIDRLYEAQEAGCEELWEAASFLGVSESFLKEAIECYAQKYGTQGKIGEYSIYFYPFKIEKKEEEQGGK